MYKFRKYTVGQYSPPPNRRWSRLCVCEVKFWEWWKCTSLGFCGLCVSRSRLYQSRFSRFFLSWLVFPFFLCPSFLACCLFPWFCLAFCSFLSLSVYVSCSLLSFSLFAAFLLCLCFSLFPLPCILFLVSFSLLYLFLAFLLPFPCWRFPCALLVYLFLSTVKHDCAKHIARIRARWST